MILQEAHKLQEQYPSVQCEGKDNPVLGEVQQ